MRLWEIRFDLESAKSKGTRLRVSDVGIGGTVVARYGDALSEFCLGQSKVGIEFNRTTEVLRAALESFGGAFFAVALPYVCYLFIRAGLAAAGLSS